MSRFSTAQVQRFYDRQTAGFLALGQGGNIGVIHRAVWGPGVVNRHQAFHYVEDRIAGFIKDLAPDRPVHVVDLGCGVGSSLCYLGQALPIRGTGITLSPVQVEFATRRIKESGAPDIVCLQGDYCDLPPLDAADFAYAIESFLHCQEPERFFAQCSRLIRPGGQLAICDDFRRPTADRDAAQTIERFTGGWNINALLRIDELCAMARRAGFETVSTFDLSPYLEIHRARDRAIDVFLALFGWLPLHRTPLAHLVGGSALQTCLERGWVGYELALFRRVR